MQRCRLWPIIYILLCSLFALTGCGESKENNNADALDSPYLGMKEEADIQYEVPSSTPHILIDQLGYQEGGTKTVVLFGESIPNSFEVVDTALDVVVFIGKIDNVSYKEDLRMNVAYGDFTDLKKEGHYRIRADKLGYSYEFSISDDIYDELLNNSIKEYYFNRCGMTLTEEYSKERSHTACHTSKAVLRDDMNVSIDVTGGWHQDDNGSKTIEDASKAIGTMLLSYELFPNSFKDNVGIPESGNDIPDILDEIKYEIDWLIKMQNESTGEVYSALTIKEDDGAKITSYVEKSTSSSARAFSYALSKFGYLYQKYDREFSTDCLKRADRAWKYARLNDESLGSSEEGLSLEDRSWEYAASSEIYRATGNKEYKDYIENFLGTLTESEWKVNEVLFLGLITYINTKQDVNTEYCAYITDRILKDAEEVSSKVRAADFLVPENISENNNLELLDQMILMTLVDYVIPNHEYDTIIENYLHYFLGLNKKSVCYLDDIGSINYKDVQESLGIMNEFNLNAKLIFMLGKLFQ